MFLFAQTMLVFVFMYIRRSFSCGFRALFLICAKSKGFVSVNSITLWVNIFVIELTTILLISMYQRHNKFIMFLMIKQVNILNTFNAAWFNLINQYNVSTVLIQRDLTLKCVTQSTQQYVHIIIFIHLFHKVVLQQHFD